MNVRGKTVLAVLAGVLWTASLCTGAKADTAHVSVLFTRAGLILSAGTGEGVLTLGEKRYPFTISGLSVGFTVGVSRARLSGQALHLRDPESIEGSYKAVGAGGALAAGAGTVKLRNSNGVILVLSGPKVGLEITTAVAGATVQLKR